MSDIIVKNLSKSYGDNKVLSDLSFVIKKETTTAIMGESGCGKTTLLKIILGLEEKDYGTVDFGGNKISVVFQENRLCEDFSPISNIKFVTGNTVAKNEIIDILNSLGLNDCHNIPVKKLSGGMKRRVAIARALATKFDLLIMDEPFKGLDDELKDSVINFIKERTKGKTVIFVTHDLSEAEKLSDNIINL